MPKEDYFRQQADECRKAAEHADKRERRGLLQLASHYDKEAGKVPGKNRAARV